MPIDIRKQNNNYCFKNLFFLLIFLLIPIWSTLGCGTKYKGTPTLILPDLGLKKSREQVRIEVHHIIQPNGAGSWVKDAPWTEVVFSIMNDSSVNITISKIRLISEKGVYLSQGTSPAELTKTSKEMARASAESAAISAAISTAPSSGILGPIFRAISALPNLLRTRDKEEIEDEFRTRKILEGTTLASEGHIKGSGFFPIALNPQKLVVSFEMDKITKEIELPFSQNRASEIQKQSNSSEKR